MVVDWDLSPCHRNRRLLISQSRSLCKYAHLQPERQDTEGHLGAVLVGTYTQKYTQHLLMLGSCYNAFSRLDMRVDVKIPGSVESYCIDERGDKRVASDALWLETFLCGVLRAYSYADDGSGGSIRKIIGVRRFDPIMNTEVEHKFLEAAERLFFKGRHIARGL